MTGAIKEIISDGKYVELRYQVIDIKTDSVLTEVEFPLGYVHGVNTVLAPVVMEELEGKIAGDKIEVPIDCNKIYGPRDESLVIKENINNVPKEYHEVGTAILMESDKGNTKTFLVTKIDGDLIVIDGNNPLCGRQVLFKLEVINVREATDEEIECGGAVEGGANIPGSFGKVTPI